MKPRRYRVSLVGYDGPEEERGRAGAGRARRGLARTWSGLSWQLRAALICIVLAVVVLLINFA